jgi:polysaccharide export outer membrane protein
MRVFLLLRRAMTHRASMLFAAVALITACASQVGPFTWVNDYVTQNPAATDSRYVIAPGDLIAIQVFDNDKVSARGRVRSDGRIAVPLINDVAVAGKTPTQVASDVERLLKEGRYIIAPRVNVVVEEVPQVRVTVLGAVSRAGNYALDQGSGVAEALASAGGLTEFAHKDRIFVLRKAPTQVRIRFTFASLTATGPASAFRLKAGDVITVE